MEVYINLKRFFSLLLFAPLIPLVGVPGEGGEPGAAGGENAEGDEGKNTNLDGESNDGEKGQKQESTFSSQADFDKAFERRMARKERKWRLSLTLSLKEKKWMRPKKQRQKRPMQN